MSDEEEYDEADDTSEWQAEAGKWKQKASEAERAAAENAGAAARLAELEKATSGQADEHAEALKAAKAEADEAARAAEERGDKTAAEWRAEAEKWKQLSQKNEQLAKQNLAAARRLEKLDAEGATATEKAAKVKAAAEAQTAETKADLEAKATQAELKAARLAVAQELGVPTALIDLLSGASKREIEQSADKLLRELAANKQPEPETVQAAEVQQKAKEDGELAEARKLLVEAEIKALRLEVATDKKLPSGLAELLNARTREELERQADALVTAIGGVKSAERPTRGRMPTERLRSGALPEGAGDSDIDPGKLADSILGRNRGY
jgi:fused signal recognition particle receptor